MDITLAGIEADLTKALKARDSLATDTLRGLKVRIQNEQISKMRELSQDDLTALVRSEMKRRQEAAEAFSGAGRTETAEKELAEAKVLSAYLPPQLSEGDIKKMVAEVVAEGSFTAKDFGAAMGKLKARAGSGADGGTLARLLKESLG